MEHIVSNIKYDRHDEDWSNILTDPSRKRTGDTWFRDDNLGAWRHQRMHRPAKCLIDADPDSSWLTVGDGRYGTDGHALTKFGAKTVHCTDLSDKLLKVGAESGFISSYSAENAESLSFGDNAFDYVYCKESFHHFPRPYIALNEMFRVAKKAVILTEPRDHEIDKDSLSPVLDFLRFILRKRPPRHTFESVGNYLYSVSEQELEKFLLGMHFNHIAFHSLNDAYKQGVEFVPLPPKTYAEKRITISIKAKIAMLDILQSLHIRKGGILTAILFKEAPSAEILGDLKQAGFEYKHLPQNPYL